MDTLYFSKFCLKDCSACWYTVPSRSCSWNPRNPKLLWFLSLSINLTCNKQHSSAAQHHREIPAMGPCHTNPRQSCLHSAWDARLQSQMPCKGLRTFCETSKWKGPTPPGHTNVFGTLIESKSTSKRSQQKWGSISSHLLLVNNGKKFGRLEQIT